MSQEVKIKYIPDTGELATESYKVSVIWSSSKLSNVEREWDKYFKEVDRPVNPADLSLIPDSCEDLKWKISIACILHPKAELAGGCRFTAVLWGTANVY